MILGIIIALIGVVSFSLANTINKFLSSRIDTELFLTLQYTMITFIAAVVLLVSGEHFVLEVSHRDIWLIGIWGVIGYLGIWALIKGLSHLHTGVVMTVAYSYIFFSYFLNFFLLGDKERLSILSIIFAVAFFVAIGAFLFARQSEGKTGATKYIFLPIITALCWTVYFSFSNYFIKEGVMTPMQTKFYSEAIILIMSLFPLFLGTIDHKENITKKNMGIIGGVAGFSYLGGLMSFYAYGMIAGNIVNVLSIGTIILSSIFAWVFLKDALNQKEKIVMGVAVVILVGFMLSL